MIKKWYEVTCDQCGCADHYASPDKTIMRDQGWIITKDNKHFCGKDCHQKYNNQ